MRRALSLLIFGKSCPVQPCSAVIILPSSKGKEKWFLPLPGPVPASSPAPASLPSRWPQVLLPSASPPPLQPRPLVGRAEVPGLSPHLPIAGPLSDSTVLPLSLSDQRQSFLLSPIESPLSVAPPSDSVLVTSVMMPLTRGPPLSFEPTTIFL